MGITGLVPAAGESSRTKGFKLFYDWGGFSILQTVINNMSLFCQKVIIVTGSRHSEITDHLKEFGDTEIVNNPEWEQGMITSIRTGLAQTEGNDVLYCPSDYPGIKTDTFRLVLETGRSSGKLCMARFEGKQGPPLYIPAGEAEAFLNTEWKKSFRSWISSRNPLLPECGDSRILDDIDTERDYLIKKAQQNTM